MNFFAFGKTKAEVCSSRTQQRLERGEVEGSVREIKVEVQEAAPQHCHSRWTSQCLSEYRFRGGWVFGDWLVEGKKIWLLYIDMKIVKREHSA